MDGIVGSEIARHRVLAPQRSRTPMQAADVIRHLRGRRAMPAKVQVQREQKTPRLPDQAQARLRSKHNKPPWRETWRCRGKMHAACQQFVNGLWWRR